MKIKGFIFGILLIFISAVFVMDIAGFIDLKTFLKVDVFFDGWWTLAIIVPCFIGLIFSREKIYNLIGLVIGVGLLMCCQDIISFKLFYIITIPTIVFVIGLKLLLNAIFLDKANVILRRMKKRGIAPEICRAIFLNFSMNFEDEKFNNAELTCLFGRVICDLRDAVVENDRAIKVLTLFGSADIYVPNNVNVAVKSSSIFGGISDHTEKKSDLPTIYISSTCIFGGIKIEAPKVTFTGPWIL